MVGGYAPISARSVALEKEREEFRESLVELSRGARAGDILVVGGDMNAELGRAERTVGGEVRVRVGRGAQEAEDTREVVGIHGAPRRSETGKAMIEVCKGEDWIDARSQFRQAAGAELVTWWHPQTGSGHELDHFSFVKKTGGT